MAFGDSITARLGLDTAGFKSGLKDAGAAVGGFVTSVGATAGAAVGLAALEQAILKVVDAGAKIQDLSDRFGVNAESLQRLGNAAELNGSSVEGMAKGFNKLEIAQSRALGGNETIATAFAHLGVTLEDLRSLSPEQLMLKLGRSSMNAADMVAVLGKSALELRPTLAGLADGSIKAGNAIDEHLVKKLKEAHDSLTKFSQELTIIGGTQVGHAFEGWEIAKKIGTDVFADLKGSAHQLFEAVKAGSKGSFGEAAQHIIDMGLTAKQALDDVGTDNWPKDKSSKAKRKFGATDSTAGDARLGSSLSHLSEMNAAGDPELRNNIQAMNAHRQAIEVQRLEAEAARQRDLQDFAGSKATLDRADAMRQGISGLSDSDKQVGAFKTALAPTEAYLAKIEKNTAEGGTNE